MRGDGMSPEPTYAELMLKFQELQQENNILKEKLEYLEKHLKTRPEGVGKFFPKDQDCFDIPESSATNFLEYGGQQFAISSVEDITARKQREQALIESERRLKDLIANVPGVMYKAIIADPKDIGSIRVSTVIRENAGEIFELDPAADGFISDFIARMPERDRSRFVESVLAAAQVGKHWHYEGQFTKPSGQKIWFEGNSISIEVDDDIVYYGFITDITRRKEMEASLRISQAIVDKAPIGIWRMGNNGEILDVNEQAYTSLRYTRQELCSMTVFDFDPDMTPESWENRKNQFDRKSRILASEGRHQRKNGEIFPVLITSKIMEFGDLQYRVAFVQDITKIKRTEDALLQSRKMEAIGTLAGGIAHDFNNILTAILGYAQLAQLKCPENEKIQNYLCRIFEASNRAKDLVTQILDFSRHHSSGKRPVEISTICREALKLIKASIPANIEIQDCLGTTQAVINANASQIHQVVLNLSTNAAYAMRKEGGQLILELMPIAIGPDDHLAFPTLPAGNYLQLTIADTGSGISETILPRIFEPYFTTKKEGEGTGMGLATVHGIVKNHGGQIRVYSEPGVGTTFHVLFPATATPPAVFNDISSPLSVTGRESILLIDDEYFIVDIGREMLSSQGYSVEIKTDPLAALNEFRCRPDRYDLVITDWTMPGMNGEELIRELRNERPEIPIILCTGYNRRLFSKRNANIDVDAVLMKPITVNMLARTVRAVLDKNRSDNER